MPPATECYPYVDVPGTYPAPNYTAAVQHRHTRTTTESGNVCFVHDYLSHDEIVMILVLRKQCYSVEPLKVATPWTHPPLGSCHPLDAATLWMQPPLGCSHPLDAATPLMQPPLRSSHPLKTPSVSQSVFPTSVYLTSLCNSAIPLIRPLYLSHLGGCFRGGLLYIKY